MWAHYLMVIPMGQYKRNVNLLHVQENPIDNKEMHLFAMKIQIVTHGFRTLQQRAKSNPFSRPPHV